MNTSMKAVVLLFCLFAVTHGQDEWTIRNPLPTNKDLAEIVYAKGVYVAVGSFGEIIESSDGRTWTHPRFEPSTQFFSITFGNGQFVAGGEKGSIITSPDGRTWTSRNTGIEGSINSVAWGNNEFIAVVIKIIGQEIYTSVDGIKWNKQSEIDFINYLHNIAWLNGQYLAVGDQGKIITSSDGITWSIPSSGTTKTLVASAWGNNIYVAVGGYPVDTIVSSPDGIAWTGRKSIGPVEMGGSGLYDVIWDGAQFIAVGQQGMMLASPDGITWTPRKTSTDKKLISITKGDNQLVAVGEAGVVCVSPDGITSTIHSSSVTQNNLINVAWCNTLFLAVGDQGAILTSPDGIVWTSRTSGTGNSLCAITHGNNRFVAVGSGSIILTSPDGMAWTTQYSGSGTSATLRSVVWNGSLFVAVGDNGKILTSPDGAAWTNRTSGISTRLSCIIYMHDHFIAVGDNGTILISPDGILWTSWTTGTTNSLYAVVWANNQFIAAGYNHTVLTSPDGIHWTVRSPGTLFHGTLVSMVYTGDQCIAAGENRIVTSADGITWTDRTSNSVLGSVYSGVAWDGRTIVVVGELGAIFTTPYSSPVAANQPRNWHVHNEAIEISDKVIRYHLPRVSAVSIKIYSVQGGLVHTLLNCSQTAGAYAVALPSLLPSGMYIISFSGGGYTIRSPMVIVR